MTARQKDILMRLRKADIRFVIAGSYGMRTYREPHDLDILVHPHDWEKVEEECDGLSPVAGAHGPSFSFGGDVELFRDSWPRGFAFLDLQGYKKDEHGFTCWTLEMTIQWKKAFGRPKDLADIKVVESSDLWSEMFPVHEKGA